MRLVLSLQIKCDTHSGKVSDSRGLSAAESSVAEILQTRVASKCEGGGNHDFLVDAAWAKSMDADEVILRVAQISSARKTLVAL